MSGTTATGIPTREVRLGGRTFESAGEHVIAFIESCCVFTKGKWRGKPFLLLNWQKRLIYELFEIDSETRRRRYRWAYIELPKKQGKTELIAALDVYFLVADGEASPEIACAANSDEQADLVFGACKTMCTLSPALAALTECYAKEITLKENPAAKIRRCSASVGTNDGPSYSTVTLDELHEFKGERGPGLFNVLTNATGAREEPLVLMITTAGYDLESLCGHYHTHAEKLIAGELEDRTFYAKIYAAPAEDLALLYRYDAETILREHREAFRRMLAAANPSLGETVQEAFYVDQFRRKVLEIFIRYFLGGWTAVESSWLPAGAWEECEIAPFAFDADRPLYIGWDASTHRDSTALVVGQWSGEEGEGERVLRAKAHIWQAPVNPQTGKPLEGWRLPIAEVENTIREYYATGCLAAVAYDPALITWSAATLEAEGISMIETPQTHGRMVGPTQALYELILDRLFAHEPDPIYARHIRNAVARQVPGGGVRLVKTPDRKLNDAAIATVLMVAEARRVAAPAEDTTPALWFPEDDEEGQAA